MDTEKSIKTYDMVFIYKSHPIMNIDLSCLMGLIRTFMFTVLLGIYPGWSDDSIVGI